MKKLEEQLQSHLHQARIASPLDFAKIATITNRAVWVEEFGVVENIKDIQPEFGAHTLVDGRIFLKRNIRVIETRSATNRAGGITLCADRIDGLERPLRSELRISVG